MTSPDEFLSKHDEFTAAFDDVWNILQSEADETYGKLSVPARKTLAEAALALHDLVNYQGLEEHEAEFALHWQKWSIHVLKREYLGHATLFGYYFEKNYSENPDATVQTDISYLVSLRALERCGVKLPREGTAWKWFIRDLPKFRDALDRFLKNEPPELRTNLLFLLLNTIDTLDATGEATGIVAAELQTLKTIAQRHEEDLRVTVGLQVYASDIEERIGIGINAGDLPEGARWKSGAFLALLRLRRGQDIQFPTESEERVPPHLWWVAKAWRLRSKGEATVGLLPFFRRLNIDAIAETVWGPMHDLLNNVTIEEAEVQEVLSLDAKGVKKLVHDYFTKHASVTPQSKARLKAELEKPDAGGEISDFNVEIASFKAPLWVAMPIKSGKEAKGKSRQKLEERFIYQFIRPLIHFGANRVAVFPILLVEPTLNTNEMLSLVRAHLNLPIFVVDTELFTRIMKKSGIMPCKK